MFKLALLFVVGAAAVNTAPVISLDLAEVQHCNSSDASPCGILPIVGGTNTASDAAHFSDECEVNTVCNLPTPKAYDHHEGDISDRVEQTYSAFVTSAPCAAVVSASNPCTPTESVADAAANFNFSDSSGTNFNETRGMYVIKYDVKDLSDNAAEQVKFAVIVRDTTAPTSTFTQVTQTQEKGATVTYVPLPANAYTDNYDTYVEQPDAPFPTDSCTASDSVDEVVHDYASIFGADNVNNAITTTFTWTVSDTVAPVVTSRGIVRAAAFATAPTVLTTPAATADVTYIECEASGSTYAKGADGASHATTSVFEFTDEGDACDNVEPTLALTSVKTNAAGVACVSDCTHGSTIVLTVIASDSVPLASDPKTHTFNIQDTTPPAITHDATYMDSHDTSTAGAFETGESLTETTTGGGNKNSGSASVKNLNTFTNSIVQHSAGYTKDFAQIENLKDSFSCADDCGATTEASVWHRVSAAATCDSLATTADGATSHATAEEAYKGGVSGTNTFDFVEVGTYILKFTCTDAAALTKSECKTVYNVDHTRPILNLITNPSVGSESAACTSWRTFTSIQDGTCEESHPTRNYVDAGATCSDVVDSVISELVEVSGQVVDLTSPGTYTIDYACTDTAGNSAIAMAREVYVIDATCPTCFLTGCGSGTNWDLDCTETQEASFPYADPGATCEDRNGDAVTATVSGAVNVELTGTYKITYSVTDDAGGTNFDTLGDGSTCNAFVHNTAALHVAGTGYTATTMPAQVRTVVVADSMRPVIFLQNNMMEETSSVNGWVIAAAGSAVAGIALLSFSSRKNVATHVPV